MTCLLTLLATTAAFAPTAPPRTLTQVSGIFDGLAKAFENESFDDKPSAGLSGGAKKTVDITVCGKKTQAIPGQRMKDVVRSARAPIKFNCEDGQCGTCECLVNGRKTRVCVAKVPARGPIEVKLK